jgi:glycosyltransferase involved in cell wall biosynthesis
MSGDSSVKLSIITPVKNGREFIEGCLRNVIDQNCPVAEHIVVDGASDDGTTDVLAAFAKQYNHIRWVSEADRGQSEALNRGLQLASGDIISVLNVDDFYSEGVLNFAESNFRVLTKPSFLIGNCIIWNEDGSVFGINRPKFSGLYDLLSNEDLCPVNPSQYFYHRVLHSTAGEFDTDQVYSMDIDFVFRAIQRSKVLYIDKTLGNFRLHTRTKTYRDMKSGNAPKRFEELCRQHAMALPRKLRLQYWCLQVIRSLRSAN